MIRAHRNKPGIAVLPDFFLSDGEPFPPGTPAKPQSMLIDDEAAIAESLTEILNNAGYDAIAFQDGRVAIDAARLLCPDIVIADVIMPKLNGVETVLTIRELCLTTRVMLFSGQAGTADILRQARENGYQFELLYKPIHPKVPLRRLSSL